MHESACSLLISGRVQAVGYRPFVYRLAHELKITGWVRNSGGQVEIHAEGDARSLDRFCDRLVTDAPPLARPELRRRDAAIPEGADAFRVRLSDSGQPTDITVPPDYFMCDECADELTDPQDRRYGYPFLNCTQCGPRWTVILDLPYDRESTTLRSFPLCEDCRREYEDPLDRRFHAEPIACPRCGPRVTYRDLRDQEGATGAAALERAVAALESGLVLAVKGVGGYHLICDAYNAVAVRRLRRRKQRPAKPLAVMFPRRGADQLDAVREDLAPVREEREALVSPERPIVLTARREDSALPEDIAPGLIEIGAFLPYSPLHELLLRRFGRPVVATSGNISGEPVLTDNEEATARLATIADGFLHHDRPITRPADDSVVRRIAARMKPLRVGRGMAPLEIPMAESGPAMLAVGGHMKNTLAVSDGRRAMVTPHIGDMGTRRSLEVFRQLAREMPRLYGVEPRWLVCDAHPDYATSRWARRQDLPLVEVLHHAAHASALWGEAVAGHGAPYERPMLVFTWDGVGYGGDGTLWGGESLLGRPDAWQRVGSLLPFQLPGGESAGREPWRSAAGLCWTLGREWAPKLPGDELELVRHAFARNLNAPVTSAVGRIFDAAAALVLGLERATYEAEGPMRVEALARRGDAQSAGGPRLGVLEDPVRDLLAIDWRPLIAYLVDDALPPAERAMGLHASMARAMSDLALAARERHGDFRVGLTGGVFQNRLLTGLARMSLEAHGFEVFLPQKLPCNDGAICYGQLVEAAANLRSGAAGG